jgi:aminoglycoside phosphotransferase (APT) family kinase protein
MLDPRDADDIADRFSLGDDAALSGPVARGEVGQVWRLTTARGTFAIKEQFDPFPDDEVREHAAFQEAAHAAGIPAPAVIRDREGRAGPMVGDAQIRAFGWVDLLERSPDVDPVEVGSLLASIHTVGFAGDLPTHPWYTEPVGPDRWDALVRRLLDASAPFADRLAAMRDELVALEALIEGPLDLQTCHRDLWADNVLRTTQGPLCVIDWENCGLADPSQELALVVFEFGMGDAGRFRTIHGSYRSSGGQGRIDRPAAFSMLIAQLGHIGEDACERWMDATGADERDRQAARADEFVSLPLTRDAIVEILDAVRS